MTEFGTAAVRDVANRAANNRVPDGLAGDSDYRGPETVTASRAYHAFAGKKEQPANTVPIDHLALGAVNPAALREAQSNHNESNVDQWSVAGVIPDDDENTVRESTDALSRLAYHGNGYAAYLLQQVKADPVGLAKALEDRVGRD